MSIWRICTEFLTAMHLRPYVGKQLAAALHCVDPAGTYICLLSRRPLHEPDSSNETSSILLPCSVQSDVWTEVHRRNKKSRTRKRRGTFPGLNVWSAGTYSRPSRRALSCGVYCGLIS